MEKEKEYDCKWVCLRRLQGGGRGKESDSE
jgi:hypothetical protein